MRSEPAVKRMFANAPVLPRVLCLRARLDISHDSLPSTVRTAYKVISEILTSQVGQSRYKSPDPYTRLSLRPTFIPQSTPDNLTTVQCPHLPLLSQEVLVR